MSLFDSKEWIAMRLFIKRFFFLFIESDCDDYIIAEVRTYKLYLEGEQIVLILKWIRKMFLMMGINPPEAQRIDDIDEIKKIVKSSIKYAKENYGMFSWNPPKEARMLKENLHNLLDEYTDGKHERYEELAKAFDAYFYMVLRSLVK